MTSRRKFIRDCSSVVTLAALAPVCALASWEGQLPEIGLKTFAVLINSCFALDKADGESQTLELIEAVGQPTAFSLLFRGDGARWLPQDTYRLEHPRIGDFEIFIVPVGHANGGNCYYEAVFNRTHTNASYG